MKGSISLKGRKKYKENKGEFNLNILKREIDPKIIHENCIWDILTIGGDSNIVSFFHFYYTQESHKWCTAQ